MVFWVIVADFCNYVCRIGPYELTSDLVSDLSKIREKTLNISFDYFDENIGTDYYRAQDFLERVNVKSLGINYTLQVVTTVEILNFGSYDSFFQARSEMLGLRNFNHKYHVTLWDQIGNVKYDINRHLRDRVIVNVVQLDGDDTETRDDIIQFLC